MKRLVILLASLILIASASYGQSDDPSASVFALASLVPANSEGYIGLRIDDLTIAEIDGLIARAAGIAGQFGALPGDIPTVRSSLATGMITPETVDQFLAGAGPTLAIAMSPPSSSGPGTGTVFVTLDDRTVMEAAVIGLGLRESGPRGSYTAYSNSFQTVLIGDDVMIAANDATGTMLDTLINGDYPRLNRDEAFNAGIASLPINDYGIGLFARVAELDRAQSGLGIDTLTAGAVLFDGDTLTIDVVLSGPALGADAAAVDPAFRRFVPADATALIHSAGLGTNLQALIRQAPVLSGSGVDPREQVAGMMAGFGIDLDEFLAWTAGDFAVFGRGDMVALIQGAMASPMDNAKIESAIGFGAAIETDNPEATLRFQRGVMSMFRMMANAAPGITLGEEDIAGVPAGVVTIQAEGVSSGLVFKLAFAATDEVFVIGTYDMVAASLSQSDGFENSTLVLDASRYWLADASTVALIDGATLMQFGVFGSLAVLGPAISNVFDRINDSLEGNAPQPTPTPSLGALNSPEQMAALLDQLSSLYRHATISGRTTDTGIVVRATITLGE